ncbi:SgcJ/EcaC family oxidoreductase [Streptacidiphilus fuscans]|uniref:SgcJ/EcaC family oxidoreductase n=1 Tax=Streptacidiphilus fuscans TaxID=2789292 RepID=A0A931AXS7_9ACTN|nr:SgcJ/EcaC family oxidoreductase [Streptacidiphilus fuscans]MBF9066819.1 SgcJ/EcaC family oxidoreductase [Streptacidiphilus fuscans]
MTLQQAAAQDETGDVQALLGRMTEAWNAGDAAAFAGQFTDEAAFVSWQGNRDSGRAAIEASHRLLFAGPLKGARMDEDGDSTVEITFLAPDVALVVVDEVRVSNSPTALVITLTAVRRGGRWRFASFQNTRKTAEATVTVTAG